MTKTSPCVITISRQLGSGGAYLGQRLAQSLKFLYLDHEIVHQAAEELKIPVEHLAVRDEKVTSNWQSVLQSFAYSTSWTYAPPSLNILNDTDFYNVESDIITKIAKQCSAVIVGRGGHYVLRDNPGCLNIFLHADVKFRQHRVEEVYHVSPEQALKLMNSVDRERARYLKMLTGQDWLDARQYHLSLDTGLLGMEKSEAIILETFRARFGNVALQTKETVKV
jgi:cytidylate kinase